MALRVGTNGDDVLHGTGAADVLLGRAGNDLLVGGGGNDWLVGGPGVDELYGEAGDDTLVYNPGEVNVTETDISGAVLDGGAGDDILVIENRATRTRDGAEVPAQTDLMWVDGQLKVAISGRFSDIDGIETVVVTGDGPFLYDGYGGAGSLTVVGTGGKDAFYAGGASEVFVGGAGDDYFMLTDDTDDVVYSGSDDADDVTYYPYASGHDEMFGFNGAGVEGGDTLSFSQASPDHVFTVAEVGGRTVFSWAYEGIEGSLTVDAVGLVEGVDYVIAPEYLIA